MAPCVDNRLVKRAVGVNSAKFYDSTDGAAGSVFAFPVPLASPRQAFRYLTYELYHVNREGVHASASTARVDVVEPKRPYKTISKG